MVVRWSARPDRLEGGLTLLRATSLLLHLEYVADRLDDPLLQGLRGNVLQRLGRHGGGVLAGEGGGGGEGGVVVRLWEVPYISALLSNQTPFLILVRVL